VSCSESTRPPRKQPSLRLLRVSPRFPSSLQPLAFNFKPLPSLPSSNHHPRAMDCGSSVAFRLLSRAVGCRLLTVSLFLTPFPASLTQTPGVPPNDFPMQKSKERTNEPS